MYLIRFNLDSSYEFYFLCLNFASVSFCLVQVPQPCKVHFTRSRIIIINYTEIFSYTWKRNLASTCFDTGGDQRTTENVKIVSPPSGDTGLPALRVRIHVESQIEGNGSAEHAGTCSCCCRVSFSLTHFPCFGKIKWILWDYLAASLSVYLSVSLYISTTNF
jgi:hypothetical protein